MDTILQTLTFHKTHKGIYSSFRLPGNRGSVNITNSLFIGGVVPATIQVSCLVPEGFGQVPDDAEKAAVAAARAQEKADKAREKAEARVARANAIAEKAQAAAAAALARAQAAAERVSGDEAGA
jgi:hypothetical protein